MADTITYMNDVLTFTREDGKFWSINIKTEEKIGYSGKVIKNVPKGYNVNRIIDAIAAGRVSVGNLNEFQLYAAIGDGEYMDKDILQVLETCYNLKVRGFYWRMSYYTAHSAWRWFTDNGYTKRNVINEIREYSAKHEEKNFDLFDVINYEKEKQFLKAFAKLIEKYGEDATREAAEYYGSDYDKTKNYMYYRYHKDMIFLVDTCEIVSTDRAHSICKEIISMCNEMNVKPRKESPITEYKTIKTNYKVWKNKKFDEFIAGIQNPAWAFENDKFVAIVPMTAEEFVKEGQNQNNCFGGQWLESRWYGIHDGRGGVMIRRKDDPDKSYITCDFYLRNMKIDQYLTKNNRTVRDPDALEFKKQLQAHLLTFCK